MIYGLKLHGNVDEKLQNYLISKLDFCERNEKIKAVLIDVNSGGGSASASEMIYNRVERISGKKPIYSMVTGMAASGAYMIICPSKKIFSIKTGIIGSIGVYSIMPDFSELLNKLGIKIRQERLGIHKNAYNPFETPDEEASQEQKKIIEGIYNIFLRAVKKNRKLKEEQVSSISKSDVYLSETAKEMGLIDVVCSYEDAINQIMKETGEVKKPYFEDPKIPLIYRIIGKFI
ncbi:S49 family peptidase [Cuniculiplasma sp. SKW4]|uniref:S49 family peptidase n=1 Tax=Cuniculiplasma sp. SKW4 TaxID=3400171 RepID=UPI003FD261F5